MKLNRVLGVVVFVMAAIAAPSAKASAFDDTQPLPARVFDTHPLPPPHLDGTHPLPPRALDGTHPLPPR